MPNVAVAGHGSLVAIELDPVASPGVYTTVAQLNADLAIKFTRRSTESTPHNDRIDSYVAGVMVRDEQTLNVNYVYGGTTHDKLKDHFMNNTTFGMRLRGPGATTSGVDEIIQSGSLTAWGLTNPVREGVRVAEMMFRPSGPFIIDGEIIGTIG